MVGKTLGHYEIFEPLGAGGMGEVYRVHSFRYFRCATSLLAILLAAGCTGRDTGPVPLTAEVPLHLEEHLDLATIEGSEVPDDVAGAMEWRFSDAQPDWKAAVPLQPSVDPVQLTRTEDALQLTLTEANGRSSFAPSIGGRRLSGGIYIDLPDWRREDWAYVRVRARTSDEIGTTIALRFNLRREPVVIPWRQGPFDVFGDFVDVIHDGSEQTYLLQADRSLLSPSEGPWSQLGIWVSAVDPASIDILSVSLVPKETTFADAPVGVRSEARNEARRRALYMHAPGRLEYRVQVPEAGRLDVGLGVVRRDAPVTFRITAGAGGGEAETLLEETYVDREEWAQRSVDLSEWAGQTVQLALEADADRAGTVALWAAPTLSGVAETDKPNVVFYVIDGAGADFMSVYGYNRRTTPNLERLAAQGAVFEHAYSNSAWTKPSTASFMTSLHHSVLGGFGERQDPVPDQAVTMAQHFHRHGYQTGVFTANPNAGSLSELQRGVDVFRDSGVQLGSASSVELHEDFWRWRDMYPAEPYWVHFQTIDVHPPWTALTPFAGLFIGPEGREANNDRWQQTRPGFPQISAVSRQHTFLRERGIDPKAFYNAMRGMYDEAMAHNDYQLGRLVERLEAAGEWDRTLLIVASDHGHPAGSFPRFGRGLMDPPPPDWEGALFGAFRSHIPMIFIWPGRIAGGQRFSEPVSMIDMLPTVLELTGSPMPEVMQGQSLAPLLLGEEGWQPRPVIFDQFRVDPATGELLGHIEVVDGRWGASLEIVPPPEEGEPPAGRRLPGGNQRVARPHTPGIPRLLLYDVWNDPYAFHSVNEERPDLVEKYTEFLEAQWKEHQALAQLFTRGGQAALTPEQIRTLRALGYIQ